MRWSLIICLLLASAVTHAKPRRRRSLGYIKNLITSKLFGTNTIVIAQPILGNNEKYQLFKIPGFDDILLKVTKTNEKEKKEDNKDKQPEKQDPIIVKPEVAIIGSYLGTTTQGETLMAIEMVKSLLQSGILDDRRDHLTQESVPNKPIVSEIIPLQNTEGTITDDRVYTIIGGSASQINIDNRDEEPVNQAEYTPLSVPEVNLNPVKTKYSYKQKGHTMDMTYESLNNQDVIVTKTEKEPPLPQFIKVRIAEAATIGANPYLVRQPIRTDVPFPYTYGYSGGNMVVPQIIPYLVQQKGIASPIKMFGVLQESDSSYAINPILMDKNPVLFSKPIENNNSIITNNMQQINRCKETRVDKICPHKVQLNVNKVETTAANNNAIESGKSSQETTTLKTPVNRNATDEKRKLANDRRQSINEFLKKNSVNGEIVSQYVYKQLSHNRRDNYTVVKVGENAISSNIDGEKSVVPEEFVFVPPNLKDEPLLNDFTKQDDTNAHTSKITNNQQSQKTITQSNSESDLRHNPIVVSETYEEKRSAVDVKTNEYDHEFGKRGDIPDSIF